MPKKPIIPNEIAGRRPRSVARVLRDLSALTATLKDGRAVQHWTVEDRKQVAAVALELVDAVTVGEVVL
jgi:hypothetical protein